MKNLRLYLFFASVITAFLIVAFLISFQITSHPKFCGTCHVMKPYYESWRSSSHSEVPCVECHIPPGVTSEFRKKYEALSMIARYITGTYSTNPWTEVDDASCLRCHERRLLAGKVVFKGVLFDHTPHLTELRRRKKLRCASCHSQIVQGAHIKATESTCFLCHFKGEKIGEDISKCTLCHEIPEKIIRKEGFEWSHADVKRFDMDCIFCHAHSVEGKGEVPRERCLTCHNEPARLGEYGKTEFLHLTHVTEHKVECLNCHQEIYHGPPKEIEMVVKTTCATCHLTGHSPQKDLYMGIGGKGVSPVPSAMYIAGIRCEGCHFIEEEVNGNRIKISGAFSCMNCHGASYYKIYRMWEKSIRDKLRITENILNRAKRRLAPELPERLKDAFYNLNMVKVGQGIHNVDYAVKLLEKAIDFANEALVSKGLRPFKKPWISLKAEARICTRCHHGIEEKRGEIFGTPFNHRTHISEKHFNCDECHRPHEEKPKGEILKFDKRGCIPCHHKPEIKRECITCHRSVLKKKISYNEKEFSHDFHIEEMELGCLDCHSSKGGIKPAACEDCH